MEKGIEYKPHLFNRAIVQRIINRIKPRRSWRTCKSFAKLEFLLAVFDYSEVFRFSEDPNIFNPAYHSSDVSLIKLSTEFDSNFDSKEEIDAMKSIL